MGYNVFFSLVCVQILLKCFSILINQEIEGKSSACHLAIGNRTADNHKHFLVISD